MYEVLDSAALKTFVSKYFQGWEKDIWKVSKISYQGVVEYLINEHYLFTVKEQ